MSGNVPYRVAQVNHTIPETSIVQQLEVEPYATGQRCLAAAHEHRVQEQQALVGQPVRNASARWQRRKCSGPSLISP